MARVVEMLEGKGGARAVEVEGKGGGPFEEELRERGGSEGLWHAGKR